MTTPVIIDIAAAAVLIGFAVWGSHRGLFKAVSGLLIVILSLAGASIISTALAGPAARLVTPILAERIEEKVDEALGEHPLLPETDDDSSIEELLNRLGLDRKLRISLTERAQEAVRDTGATVVEAVVEGLVTSAAHGMLYILSFLVLSVLLNLAARAMNLVLKLPGLHGLNALGGGLAGLAEGALLLFLAVVVLRQLGVPLVEPPWSDTYFLRIFTAI